jgi:hypothetical protein
LGPSSGIVKLKRRVLTMPTWLTDVTGLVEPWVTNSS